MIGFKKSVAHLLQFMKDVKVKMQACSCPMVFSGMIALFKKRLD